MTEKENRLSYIHTYTIHIYTIHTYIHKGVQVWIPCINTWVGRSQEAYGMVELDPSQMVWRAPTGSWGDVAVHRRSLHILSRFSLAMRLYTGQCMNDSSLLMVQNCLLNESLSWWSMSTKHQQSSPCTISDRAYSWNSYSGTHISLCVKVLSFSSFCVRIWRRQSGDKFQAAAYAVCHPLTADKVSGRQCLYLSGWLLPQSCQLRFYQRIYIFHSTCSICIHTYI